jgi:hypothetical protein
MGEYKRYKDLLIWQKAMELITEIYTATRRFPAAEQFTLTSQMRTRLNYCDSPTSIRLLESCAEIESMLNSFIRKLPSRYKTYHLP